MRHVIISVLFRTARSVAGAILIVSIYWILMHIFYINDSLLFVPALFIYVFIITKHHCMCRTKILSKQCLFSQHFQIFCKPHAMFIFLAVKIQLKNANVILLSQDVHRQRNSGEIRLCFKKNMLKGKIRFPQSLITALTGLTNLGSFNLHANNSATE